MTKQRDRCPTGCLVPLLGLLAGAALAQGPATWTAPYSTDQHLAYECRRATSPIVMDGKMDEAAWAGAQEIKGFVIPPKLDWPTLTMTRPKDADSRSLVRLLWDDKGLYLGADLQDRDLYCVTPAGHDNPFGPDDIVELFVKPSTDLPYYWELHVVPSGGTRDYFYARRGSGGEKRWKPYDSGMKAQVALYGTLDEWSDRDTKWVVEMFVPWTAFARMGGAPHEGALWQFLVSRYDYSVHLEEGCQLSAAAPLPRADFHLHEFYPYMRFVK